MALSKGSQGALKGYQGPHLALIGLSVIIQGAHLGPKGSSSPIKILGHIKADQMVKILLFLSSRKKNTFVGAHCELEIVVS